MDRNLYKSQKKLTDNGWRAMRKALDQELPEQRRRRPVALFWILGLLLPTAGLLAWLALRPGTGGSWPEQGIYTATAPPVSPLPDRQVSGRERVSTQRHSGSAGVAGQINMAPTPSGKPQPTLNAATENGTQETRPAPAAAPGDMLPGQQAGATVAQTTPAAVSANPEPLSQQLPFPELTAVPAVASEPTPAALPENTPEQQLQPAGINSPGLPATPSATPVSAGITDAFELLPIEPVHPKPSGKWSFGVYAGVLSDITTGSTGATTGLSAEWRLAEKWGLRSGVAYQFQNLRGENRPVLSVSTNTYAEVTGDAMVYENFGSVPNAADGSEPVYIPVSRVHRLEVPVQAFWQPFRRWRLWGGASIGSNLYAEAGNRSLKNNTVLNVQKGVASKNLSQQISGQLRNWDSRWITGIGFRPNQRLAVDLYYHHPLKFSPRKADAQQFDSGQSNRFFNGAQQTISNGALFQLSATMFF